MYTYVYFYTDFYSSVQKNPQTTTLCFSNLQTDSRGTKINLFLFLFLLTHQTFFIFQVGYESPHPHMRVPGLPANLQSAASGKP